jgi:hypothetical protein
MKMFKDARITKTISCIVYRGDRDVSHDLVAHSGEEGPLKWLRVEICNHLVRG